MPVMPETLVHDVLLDALSSVESVETIKLVARLCDPRIGNANTTTAYIFLPDTHLVSRAKINTRFNYGFNHERTYVDILKKIIALRSNPKFEFKVVHLGDFVDLWKENTVDPRDVLAQYQGVRDYTYGLGKKKSVDCRFLVGNHDAAVAEIEGLNSHWSHRLFIRPDRVDRFYATHGDIFDWIEKLPPKLKQWAVYYFSPKSDKPATGLKDIVAIQKDKSLPVPEERLTQLGSQKKVVKESMDERFNVGGSHKFLESSFERVKTLNRDHACKIKVCVIGHTHNPKIALIEGIDNFFVLMDCGAWCGQYAITDTLAGNNGQIGVICGNDIRIYQIDSHASISKQFQKEAAL